MFRPVDVRRLSRACESGADPKKDDETDGQTSAVPGTPTTYIIVVSNQGPSTVSSLTLTDAVPAALLADFARGLDQLVGFLGDFRANLGVAARIEASGVGIRWWIDPAVFQHGHELLQDG
jgi:uncharacterized repeat protein (TIGR01451 family)